MKTEKKNVFDYLLVFMLFLFNDSLFFYGIVQNNTTVKLVLFVVIILIIIMFKNIGKLRVTRFRIITFSTLIILTLFTMIFNNDTSLGFLYIIMLMIVGLMISSTLKLNDFANITTNILVFLSLFSIVILLTEPLWRVFDSYLIHFENEANTPMINFIFSTHVNMPGYYRLFGIFRESGVYQIFLNFALIYILFTKNKVKLYKLIIIITTIILTYSTPGYIGLIMIMLAKFLSIKDLQLLIKKHKRLALLIIISIPIFIVSSINYDPIKSVFLKLINQESSYDGRTTSIMVEIQLWLQKPLFGYGIEDGMRLSKEIGSDIIEGEMFNTSTFTGILVNFGAFFGTIILYGFIKYFRIFTNKIIPFTLILFSMLLLFSSQLLIYNAYFYTILFYGFYSKKSYKEEKT